jgi:hypothetical protein
MFTDGLYLLVEVIAILLVRKYCFFRLHCSWLTALAAAGVFRIFDYAFLVLFVKLSSLTTGQLSFYLQMCSEVFPLPLAAVSMLVFSCICIPMFYLERNSDFWVVSASLVFALASAHALLHFFWLLLLILFLGGSNQSYQSYRPYYHRDHYY